MQTRYVWDYTTNTCLAELNEHGETTVEYTVNPLTGELISERRDGEDIYHHYDSDGNTRETTDSAGNVLGQATYTAFGEVVAESGNTQTTYRLRGQQGFSTDSLTGDVSRDNQNYSPSLGRRLSLANLRTRLNRFASGQDDPPIPEDTPPSPSPGVSGASCSAKERECVSYALIMARKLLRRPTIRRCFVRRVDSLGYRNCAGDQLLSCLDFALAGADIKCTLDLGKREGDTIGGSETGTCSALKGAAARNDCTCIPPSLPPELNRRTTDCGPCRGMRPEIWVLSYRRDDQRRGV